MRQPKVRELMEAIRALFGKRFTTKFPFEPSIPPEGFRGKPVYSTLDRDCVGCSACAEVCPAKAIKVIEEIAPDGKSGKRKLVQHPEICIYCGQCERACITQKGIKLTLEYDLATVDKTANASIVEKDLVICQNCFAVITTFDHLMWLSDKLGTLSFTNPTVMLAKQKELELLENIVKDSPHPRGGHLRFLCPNCRREQILKEQW
ncbi:MAG: 4Fe-4S dicluster domain-containing protein [Candidatus Saganbacteria bacterium]|nr:4Fe-4S dicluster domain-containing protein [Candidatus Saganbacteria bacterium]